MNTESERKEAHHAAKYLRDACVIAFKIVTRKRSAGGFNVIAVED